MVTTKFIKVTKPIGVRPLPFRFLADTGSGIFASREPLFGGGLRDLVNLRYLQQNLPAGPPPKD